MIGRRESLAESPEPVTIWFPLVFRILFAANFASIPALIVWIGIEEEDPWLAAVFLMLALVVTYRVAMISVSFTPQGLVIRNLGRYYRLKWPEINAIVAGKQWTRAGYIGTALVLTSRAAKPGSFGPDSLKTNPLVPMPWVFGLRPPVSIHIAASTGPGRKRKARLVEAVKKFQAVGLYEVDLNEEDLDRLPYDQFSATLSKGPERQRPR